MIDKIVINKLYLINFKNILLLCIVLSFCCTEFVFISSIYAGNSQGRVHPDQGDQPRALVPANGLGRLGVIPSDVFMFDILGRLNEGDLLTFSRASCSAKQI